MTTPRPQWPENKSFAFTVFDDPDAQLLKHSREIYAFLADLGFRTTKGVWPSGPLREPNSPGDTCANAEYREHVIRLQESDFEIGYHNNAPHSSTRAEIIAGLDAFREYFGRDPSPWRITIIATLSTGDRRASAAGAAQSTAC